MTFNYKSKDGHNALTNHADRFHSKYVKICEGSNATNGTARRGLKRSERDAGKLSSEVRGMLKKTHMSVMGNSIEDVETQARRLDEQLREEVLKTGDWFPGRKEGGSPSVASGGSTSAADSSVTHQEVLDICSDDEPEL